MHEYPPVLPTLDLPITARTHLGETVRIRALITGETRVESPSEFEDWGPFDVKFHDDDHHRAMIEVLTPREDRLRSEAGDWTPVGDMSWHAKFYGPNLGSRTANIGLALAPATRGRGIGTVAQSLLATALHRAGVTRVEAETDVANPAERKSLMKAGFRREGILRTAQQRADGLHDLEIYSCLPGEPALPSDGS